MQNIKIPIVRELDKMDKLFREFFATEDSPVENMLNYLSQQTGKKIRPLILLLSAEISGNINDLTLKYATIFEALHTASLIHDDIIDLAELRRGEKSVNHKYGNKLAVLAGDFLLSRSLLILTEIGQNEIIKIYARASENLCLGELLEQQVKTEKEFSEENYFKTIGLKPASLFAACGEVGVVATGGTAVLRQQMKAFGESFGLAFQLKDDLLDFVGSCEETGKETGKDFAENIMTYPVLAIMKNSRNIPEVEKLLAEKNFVSLKALIEKAGGFRLTEEKIAEYSRKCYEIIDQLPESQAGNALKKLVKSNETRKK
jgi:octaprenyl-diphosphate synthase